MAPKTRAFRSPESLAAEAMTRDAVVPFLAERGFKVVEDQRKVTGTATEQFVVALAPDGQNIKMRVRLCWRRDGRKPGERQYAATQLRARLRNDDWEGTVRFIVERDLANGITHCLVIQRDGAALVFAALIPRDALMPIWLRQRDVSDDLRRRNLMGNITKNHATNGSSPTLWLQDDRTPAAHAVADALWSWPHVVDLAKMKVGPRAAMDDSLDDCPIFDYDALGSDGAERRPMLRSEIPRDVRVRQAVIERASGCERSGCGESRSYRGFLDVHHILGAENGDRVWNCVALCPNCHREAYFAPTADKINAQLLAFAERFRSFGDVADRPA
ncbi:MAG: HNH endonuclease [Burkholderiales bacterium]|nr:HNH endonuclease [Burkholderiales bacterium]